ncbi:MAG: hypothetical protein QOD99_2806 [Chthoniobacter sp.]|jgi:hypothetical protein|nr:hypothetical protein [Chthoniobacter sp.]
MGGRVAKRHCSLSLCTFVRAAISAQDLVTRVSGSQPLDNIPGPAQLPAMENLYVELANALRERVAIIANGELRARDPVAHLEGLKSISEKIGRLALAVPADADPQLRHYLARCSYEKALAALERP